VVIHGKWRGEPKGAMVLEGQSAAGSVVEVAQVRAPDPQAVALRHLWARERIAALSDQEALEGGSRYRNDITTLGLRYSLLTQYTSFIAVDEVVRTSEVAEKVNQPLPLPKGVSNAAVGAAVPSTPEPAAWLAALVALVLIGVAIRRQEA
jgi:Ca-activated chloride channel family protein